MMKKFNKESDIYRHGDVNLHKVSETKGEPVEHRGSFILAEGEATGSVHLLTMEKPEDLTVTRDGWTYYYHLQKEGKLTHTADHETILIQPGVYKQVMERELDHFADSVQRKVVD